MVTLITIMVSTRQCGDSVEIDTFYGDFMVELAWKLSGEFMEKTW